MEEKYCGMRAPVSWKYNSAGSPDTDPKFMAKNRIAIVLLAVLLLALALYRAYTSGSHLNVEPHAAQEIEKAKRR